MKKPSLILHIGTEKTGTTSIQQFLSENRDYLLEQGFFVPNIWGSSNQFWLPFLMTDDGKIDNFLHVSHGFTTREEVSNRRQQIEARFCDLIHGFSDKSWIISSEHLHSRLHSNDELGRLRSFTDRHFSDVKILMFIRRPINAALSLWSTALKSGSLWRELPPPDHPKIRVLCDHQSSLRRWENFFGDNSINVIRYDRLELGRGGVTESFCKAIGIGFECIAHPCQQGNQSLSARGMAVMLAVNSELPAFANNKQCLERRNIYQYVEALLTGESIRPSLDDVLLYEDYYRESDKYIKSHLFPHEFTLWNGEVETSCLTGRTSIPALSDQEESMVRAMCASWSELSQVIINEVKLKNHVLQEARKLQEKIRDLVDRLQSISEDSHFISHKLLINEDLSNKLSRRHGQNLLKCYQLISKVYTVMRDNEKISTYWAKED